MAQDVIQQQEVEEEELPTGKKDGWGLLSLAFPVAQILLLLILQPRLQGYGWLLQAGFLLITAVAGWQIVTRRRTYSLQQVFWVFVLVYFGLAPAIQTATGLMPWSNNDPATAIPQSIMLQALAGILGVLLVYSLVYQYFNRRYSVRRRDRSVARPDIPLMRYGFTSGTVLAVALLVSLYFIGGRNLFFRLRLEEVLSRYQGTVVLLAGFALRGAMLYISLVAIWLYRHDRIKAWIMGLVLFVVFILNFPLAVPRFLAGAFYLSWLLATHWKVITRRNIFAITLIGALAVAAPLTNALRMQKMPGAPQKAIPAYLIKHAFMNEYDGYATLCRTMMYTSQYGVTLGRQAAGAALFFVPRSAWPDKPVGSGALVYRNLGFEWTNIASPLFAEGYINFGWVGAVLFAALLAWLIAAYDAHYWRFMRSKKGGGPRYLLLFYPVAMSMLLFILRGDLLSSVAYTAGLFVAGLLLHTFLQQGQQDKYKINPMGRAINKRSASSSAASSGSGSSSSSSSSSSSRRRSSSSGRSSSSSRGAGGRSGSSGSGPASE